jgi:hypothetical protein
MAIRAADRARSRAPEGWQVEHSVEFRLDVSQVPFAQNWRRSAARVKVGNATAENVCGNQIDLRHQPTDIAIDRIAPAHGFGVAAAIKAKLDAKRNMQVRSPAHRRGRSFVIRRPAAGRSG